METLSQINELLKEHPMSISDVVEKAGINWRTAREKLETLKSLGIAKEISVKNKRVYFLIDNNNYFGIPVKKEHSDMLSTIFSEIKKECLKIYNKEPTRTQVYKIVWDIDRQLKLNLPVGWYLYGPCVVQKYTGNEEPKLKLKKELSALVKEKTKEYCSHNTSKIQNKVYLKSDNKLYLAKEKLLSISISSNKNELNPILMDLIKNAPEESVETVTDFARLVLLRGWDNHIRILFDYLWSYIGMVSFKESIPTHYNDIKDMYFDERINDSKREVQTMIVDLAKEHLK